MKKPKYIRKNVLLAPLTSYNTGGTARFFAEPNSINGVSDAVGWAVSLSLPFFVIGAGSNLLVSDAGFDGLVIRISEKFSGIQGRDGKFNVKCGTMLNDLVYYVNNSGFAGIQELAGIPGTIGGAIVMNAGAFGQEIKDHLKEVKLLDVLGKTCCYKADELEMSYRTSSLKSKNYIVLEAEFVFNPGKKTDIRKLNEDSRNILNRRSAKQPLEFKSCGSVFERPSGYYAGSLIDECGLKGYGYGGAEVSHKHANFIVNMGNATSNDIYNVMKHVEDEVYKKKGIILKREVVLVGKF
ncbi:MAG: UDP-N-acetylmuramate dehydrogenase [bacterium]